MREGSPRLTSPSWLRGGGPLILKLVIQSRSLGSRTAKELGIHQPLIPKQIPRSVTETVSLFDSRRHYGNSISTD